MRDDGYRMIRRQSGGRSSMRTETGTRSTGSAAACLRIWACFLATAAVARPAHAGELSEVEVAEIQRIEIRLKNGELPQPPIWNCCAGPSDQGIQALIRVGIPEKLPIGQGDLLPVVRRAGSWRK